MFTQFSLEGRGVIVTGGGSGIGYGMAQALLLAGANVAIWGTSDRTLKARDALAKATNAAGRIHGFICDVSDEQQVEDTFGATAAALGQVNACFANAGVSGFAGGAGGKGTPLVEMTVEEFRRVQKTNVEGVFLTFRAASRYMVEQKCGGSLVATASIAAIAGAVRNSHYCASKGAVTALVRALAVELAKHQIRVNTILPGWVSTPMTERLFREERVASVILPRIPARRWGAIDDFGGIAVYLASDASAYTTGEQFVIDGGYTKF